MSDQKDVEKVSQALLKVWGVRQVEVNLDQEEAIFVYDESAASLADFQQAIVDSGFTVMTSEINNLDRK
jgi:copper chaperone CopZ